MDIGLAAIWSEADEVSCLYRFHLKWVADELSTTGEGIWLRLPHSCPLSVFRLLIRDDSRSHGPIMLP